MNKRLRDYLMSSTFLNGTAAVRFAVHLHWRMLGAELLRRTAARDVTASWLERFIPEYNALARACGFRGLLDGEIQAARDGWRLT